MAAAITVQADLLVLRNGGGASGDPLLMRYDDASGESVGGFASSAESFEGITAGPRNEVFLACNTLGTGEILRLDSAGQVLGAFGATTLTLPGSIRFGPDGKLYAISGSSLANPNSQILKYDSSTGELLGSFVAANAARTSLFTDLAFSPQGQLYVADLQRGILRFNGKTGRYLGVLAPAGTRGFNTPTALAFGPDKNLYAASRDENAIFRFEGISGRFMGAFVRPASGGLSRPMGLAFGPDGNLYVSSYDNHSVLRYNGRTGQFIGIFVGAEDNLTYPTQLIFTPSARDGLAQLTRIR